MERERPEYLQPIPRTRWEFPWLGLWAVLLLGMAAAGIWLHLRTGDAWNARFHSVPGRAHSQNANQPAQTEPTTNRKAELAAMRARQELAAVRVLREQAEEEVRQQRTEHRCIGGVAFRRIPGGWENIPGETCQ
ncbi:TPA: hypothetical protein UOA91_004249 [Stenotrophomonas maltophilia]|nr:hypothetical protein [Stenotrophomonas maltophilia]HEL5007986.1 hypothetical protein [Stenotrophomonas maltophilia]